MTLKIAMLVLLLTGCGFRPLYGNHQEILTQTAAVQIMPVSGDGGYQIGLILKDKLNPYHQTVPVKYRLNIVLMTPRYTNQSIRTDNFATLERMDLSARYELTDVQTNTVLISSVTDANGLFNLVQDPYATVTAQEKLYDNLIQGMADDSATHVLSYFRGTNP